VAHILNILRSRTARAVVLAFQALWLNVVLPGHQRGVVALPGSACANCQLALSAPCQHGSASGTSDSNKPAPGDPASHCAICHFAAMLSLPPVIDLSPPAHGFLELRPIPIVERLVSLPFPATYDGRAPPVLNFQPV
jgi:hypothetical protein